MLICFHFRTNLAPVILQLKSMGIDNVLRFEFLAVGIGEHHSDSSSTGFLIPISLCGTKRRSYFIISYFSEAPLRTHDKSSGITVRSRRSENVL